MQVSSPSIPQPLTFIGVIASIWGTVGFFALLLIAVTKLSAMAFIAMSQPLSVMQWLILFITCVFMAYSEGYKGFQKSYSPRFAARVRYLASHSSFLQMVLAPFFCMGFFNAPRRRVISSILLTLMIVMFVLAFKLLPQPWRGILDAGVVVGLVWGMIATAGWCFRAFFSARFDVDSEVC